jgi:hypothetical protein
MQKYISREIVQAADIEIYKKETIKLTHYLAHDINDFRNANIILPNNNAGKLDWNEYRQYCHTNAPK